MFSTLLFNFFVVSRRLRGCFSLFHCFLRLAGAHTQLSPPDELIWGIKFELKKKNLRVYTVYDTQKNFETPSLKLDKTSVKPKIFYLYRNKWIHYKPYNFRSSKIESNIPISLAISKINIFPTRTILIVKKKNKASKKFYFSIYNQNFAQTNP